MCHDSKPLELITHDQISLAALSTGGRCISAMIMDRIPYSSFIPHSVCWEYPSALLAAANMSTKFYNFCSRDSPHLISLGDTFTLLELCKLIVAQMIPNSESLEQFC